VIAQECPKISYVSPVGIAMLSDVMLLRVMATSPCSR
jgi:hypothetical protein